MLGFFFSRALCLSFLVLLPFSELRCCSSSNCIFASHLFEIALFTFCYFSPFPLTRMWSATSRRLLRWQVRTDLSYDLWFKVIWSPWSLMSSALMDCWLISMTPCSFPSQTDYASLNWRKPRKLYEHVEATEKSRASNVCSLQLLFLRCSIHHSKPHSKWRMWHNRFEVNKHEIMRFYKYYLLSFIVGFEVLISRRS